MRSTETTPMAARRSSQHFSFVLVFVFVAFCFQGSKNLISERFSMGWPSIAGIGKPILPRMRREPHAAVVRPN